MENLTYSSNPNSKLNSARRSYWVSRHMLSEANKTPGRFDMGLRFWVINKSRSELRKVAHELRAKLPAKKVYKVAMRGESSEFGFWVRAHTMSKATKEAEARYNYMFKIVSVELVE